MVSNVKSLTSEDLHSLAFIRSSTSAEAVGGAGGPFVRRTDPLWIDGGEEDEGERAARVEEFVRGLDAPLLRKLSSLRRTSPTYLRPSHTAPAGLSLSPLTSDDSEDASSEEDEAVESIEAVEEASSPIVPTTQTRVRFADEPARGAIFSPSNDAPGKEASGSYEEGRGDQSILEDTEEKSVTVVAEDPHSAASLASAQAHADTRPPQVNATDLDERSDSLVFVGRHPPSPRAIHQAFHVNEVTLADARHASTLFSPAFPPVPTNRDTLGALERHASVLFPVTRAEFQSTDRQATSRTPDARIGSLESLRTPEDIAFSGIEPSPGRGWVSLFLRTHFVSPHGISLETIDAASARSCPSFAATASSLLSGRTAPSSIRWPRRARGTVSPHRMRIGVRSQRRELAMAEASTSRFSIAERPPFASITLRARAPAAAAAHRALARDWSDAARLLRSVAARAVDANADDARILREYFAVTALFIEEYFHATHVLSAGAGRRVQTKRKALRDVASASMRSLITAVENMVRNHDEAHINAALQAADVARTATLAAVSAEADGRGGLNEVSVDALGERLAMAESGKFLVLFLARGVVRDCPQQKRKWASRILFPGVGKYCLGPLVVLNASRKLWRVHTAQAILFQRAEMEYRKMFNSRN